MTAPPILLSPPHLGELESKYVMAALEANWVAPLGPDLVAFEQAVAERVGRQHAVALTSGTAALHLALHALGIGPGDVVLVPTLTFAATVNAVLYTGATPVFVDCDDDTWTLSPELVATAVGHGPVRAVVPVDLYGQCADYDTLARVCPADVEVVSDAAESLGASYGGRPAGSFGHAAILSFNGNKIVTTGGGGMLVTDDEQLALRVRYLSTQAKDPVAHYEHQEMGFNYRMSNILAALGRGQIAVLDERVAARQSINRRYRELLAAVPGLVFMPQAAYGVSNSWLTCLLLDPHGFRADREDVRQHLAAHGIEARPTWKPLHLQPAYEHLDCWGGTSAEKVFEQGLCLPSGSALSPSDVERVAATVLSTPRRP